jgi:phage major head subunit gpT-like protein
MYNSPAVLLKGIQARFLRGLATTAPAVLSPFFEEAKSDTNKEAYVLFNHFGTIKEWVDEIEFSHLEDFDFEIKNKDWQNGFLVDRNTLDDSKKTLGNDVEREINFSLSTWTNFPDRLVTELIVAGESGLAFDGTAFFTAGGRPALQLPGTTIDNLITGTGITVALITADLVSAVTKMRSYTAKNGDPFNYSPKWVALIPPHLEFTFRTIRDSENIIDAVAGATKTNIYKGTFDYVVNDYLGVASNDWYLTNVNTPFKPFIYQTRKSPSFDMKDEKDQKFLKYFSTGRMNVGYGNPLAMAKINN